MLEAHAAPHLESGALVRVLEDWCPPFAGYFLYYPSRRQQPAALSALIDAFVCKALLLQIAADALKAVARLLRDPPDHATVVVAPADEIGRASCRERVEIGGWE